MPQETLTATELDAMWERWTSSKDEIARAELVGRYLPLVRLLASQLRSQVSSYLQPELYSLGLLGLLDAIDKFDPARGYRFETYGAARIRGAMRDGVRRMAPLPRGARERAGCMIMRVDPVDFQGARTAEGVRLQDRLADLDQPSALEGLELQADHEELLEAVESLPARERKVIRLYYFENIHLKAIGVQLGVTESRICQIHRRALEMLELRLRRIRAA